MLTIKARRLDQITLYRHYPLYKKLAFKKTLEVALDHCKNGEFDKVDNGEGHASVFQKSYPGKKWGTGIAFRFFGLKDMGQGIAISCNPVQMSDDDWADFHGFLETMFPYGAKQIWKEFKISALEFAVDVKLPFDELLYIAPKVSEIGKQYLKDGTLYLGHEYGRRSYCIYDKRKQLAEVKKYQLGYDLTRIEVTLRQTGKLMGKLEEFSRPFGKLLAFRRPVLQKLKKTHPNNLALNAFLIELKSLDVAQEAYLALDPYSRKQLLKLLSPVALNLNGKPAEWKSWVESQKQILQQKFWGSAP